MTYNTKAVNPYFGIIEHRTTVSRQDFIDGKMPEIVKQATEAGEMVSIRVEQERKADDVDG